MPQVFHTHVTFISLRWFRIASTFSSHECSQLFHIIFAFYEMPGRGSRWLRGLARGQGARPGSAGLGPLCRVPAAGPAAPLASPQPPLAWPCRHMLPKTQLNQQQEMINSINKTHISTNTLVAVVRRADRVI